MIPAIENTVATTYWVEGATVFTTRSFFDPATQRPLVFKVELWKGYSSYDPILLIALILATPGWSLRQRGRLLGLGCVLITLTEFAFFLSTIEYSQLRPVLSQTGSVLLPVGFSRPKQILVSWVYYFFHTMGRGLFPLLIYWGMVGLTWRPPLDKRPPKRRPSRLPAGTLPAPAGAGKSTSAAAGRVRRVSDAFGVDMTFFPSDRFGQLGSVCPCNNESAGKHRSGENPGKVTVA